MSKHKATKQTIEWKWYRRWAIHIATNLIIKATRGNNKPNKPNKRNK